MAIVILCGKNKAVHDKSQWVVLDYTTTSFQNCDSFAVSEDFSPAKASCNRKGKSHNVQNAALGSRVSGRKTSSVADRGDGPEAVILNKVNTANASHESVWLINVNKWMQQMRFFVSLQASAFSRRSKKTNGDGQTVTGKSEALSHIHIQGKNIFWNSEMCNSLLVVVVIYLFFDSGQLCVWTANVSVALPARSCCATHLHAPLCSGFCLSVGNTSNIISVSHLPLMPARSLCRRCCVGLMLSSDVKGSTSRESFHQAHGGSRMFGNRAALQM